MSPRPFQVIRAKQVSKKAHKWVRRRPLLFIPAYVLILQLLMLADYPGRRIAIAATACLVIATWWVIAALRVNKTAPPPNDFFVASLITTTLHAVLCGLTGGISSPLLPLLLGSPIGLFMLYGRSVQSKFAAGMVLVPLLVLLLLPSAWAGPPIEGPWRGYLAAFSVLYTAMFLRTSAMLLVDVYLETGRTLAGMREELLVGSTRRAQAIEAMGAKVAHELKNPLAAVKGLVQLLNKSATDERASERLGVVISELARIESIIAGYLSFSQPLEALEPRLVELDALVDEVLAVLEARGNEKGVTLVREGSATIVGDGRRLKEAVLNLVTNGIDATRPNGSVRVVISPEPEGASVRVVDTGEGLSDDDLHRLGTPFFTRRENGTGLGVVLARAAIIQHGGQIAFESELGQGTVVTFTLPNSPSDRDRAHG